MLYGLYCTTWACDALFSSEVLAAGVFCIDVCCVVLRLLFLLLFLVCIAKFMDVIFYFLVGIGTLVLQICVHSWSGSNLFVLFNILVSNDILIFVCWIDVVWLVLHKMGMRRAIFIRGSSCWGGLLCVRSSLRLEVLTGKRTKTPLANRLCRFVCKEIG